MEISKAAIISVVLVSLGVGVITGPVFQVYLTNLPLDEEGNLRVTIKDEANQLLASNHLTAILNVQKKGSGSNPDVLRAFNQVVGLGNKTVTFIGGESSGGITWCHYGNQYLAGQTPGIGRVEVYSSNNTFLAEFVLPLDTMFTVQNVDKIKVYAESPIPRFAGDYGYSAFVVSSVYWVEG